MNIKQAKEQIHNAMKAYFTKDRFGEYVIPIEQQRPIFLMGPPGIGKTAIMEQIAAELGVGLVSYSMTHHTRQSALGLPFIEKKNYGGKEYSVSEYTMSEIIASVYDVIETTGMKEGILFLDEINCVSETLAPSMLQFLQYKVFGRHSVPKGWIVVTAGNPPEYNNSVREFDIVTWDRLKRIDVEPDYKVWKEYAYKKGIHAAVISYLDIKMGDFYKIETTVDGKSFVTARGWSDLSDMIKLYEQNDITVDSLLISQYIQNKNIAKDFAIYYDLFNKYRSDYQVDKIIEGKADDEIKNRAKAAKFDERLALLALLLDAVMQPMREVTLDEKTLTELMNLLKKIRMEFAVKKAAAVEIVESYINELTVKIQNGKQSFSMSVDDEYSARSTIAILEKMRTVLIEKAPKDNTEAFKLLKSEFDANSKALKKRAEAVSKKLNNVLVFCEDVFTDGQEMLIMITELTIGYYSVHFISRHGCEKYFEYNKGLLLYERQNEILCEIEELEL